MSTMIKTGTTPKIKRSLCSLACDACKRRRRKCSGVHPCDYCVESDKADTCSFSASAKRGPKTKNLKTDEGGIVSLCNTWPNFFQQTKTTRVLANNTTYTNNTTATNETSPAISISPSLSPSFNPAAPAFFAGATATSVPVNNVHNNVNIPVTTLSPRSSGLGENSILVPGVHRLELNEIMDQEKHSLFHVAPYMHQIQEFIDISGLSSFVEVKSTYDIHQHVVRAQSYSLLASVARHNDELVKAETLMNEVAKNLKEIYEEPTLEAAVAFFCASLYYPFYVTKAKFYYTHAWHLAESVPAMSKKDEHTKAFIFLWYKLSDTTMSVPERSAAIAKYFLNTIVKLDDFEMALLQIARVFGRIGEQLDLTDAYAALRVLPDVHFSGTEKMELLLDFNILESFMKGLPSLAAFQSYIKSIKILVLWKSGEIATATEDAIQFLLSVEAHPEVYLLFYYDLLPLLLLVEFFKENNNIGYAVRMGQCASQLVHRSLVNQYFKFYRDILDKVLPVNMFNAIQMPEESLFEFSGLDIPGVH